MQREIYLAGGCFWGVQHYLDELTGVVSTECGYCNGNKEVVSYKEVCSGTTDHTECVKVVYDEELITLEELLDLFFIMLNPKYRDPHPDDVKRQYRFGVYAKKEDFGAVEPVVQAKLQALKADATTSYQNFENLPLENYCGAEEYHQKYIPAHPTYVCEVDINNYTDIIAAQNAKTAQRRSK